MEKQKNYIQKLVDQFAKDNKTRIAFKLYDGKKIKDINYKQFAEDILCATSFLKEKAIVKEHIALIGTNSYEWLVTFFSIIASGNIAVLLNQDLPKYVQKKQCKLADVSVVCGDKALIDNLVDTGLEIPYENINGKEPISIQDIEDGAKEDTTILMFTSGTTEKSKIVEITYENMYSSVTSMDNVFSLAETEKIMTILPMYHIAGLRGVLAMLYRYKTLCIGRGVMYLFKDMQIFSPSYIQLVPMIADSMVKIMKHTPQRDVREKYFGKDLKRICIGGATVDTSVCKYLMEEGFIIDSGYAMTETTGVGTWGQWDEKHFNTIGKLSGELECKIEDGELLFRGPSIMKGYYKNKEETEKTVKDGWLHSGDLGFCDQDGYYYITGRKKHLIVMKNGEKVNPEEMEAYFKTCEAILECFVYYNGSVICIDLYTKNEESARKFIEEYNAEMPLAYQVRKIKYCSEPLKKTGSGKMIRKEAK